MTPDLLSDAGFLDLIRRMGVDVAPSPTRTPSPTPPGIPPECFDVVAGKYSVVYHRATCKIMTAPRVKPFEIPSDWPRIDRHGCWVIERPDPPASYLERLIPCKVCLPTLQPSPPPPPPPAGLGGCVVTSTGRKYHRPGCASFWAYSKLSPLTTLHVLRPNPETGDLEPVILTPCKLCQPPMLVDPDPEPHPSSAQPDQQEETDE